MVMNDDEDDEDDDDWKTQRRAWCHWHVVTKKMRSEMCHYWRKDGHNHHTW